MAKTVFLLGVLTGLAIGRASFAVLVHPSPRCPLPAAAALPLKCECDAPTALAATPPLPPLPAAAAAAPPPPEASLFTTATPQRRRCCPLRPAPAGLARPQMGFSSDDKLDPAIVLERVAAMLAGRARWCAAFARKIRLTSARAAATGPHLT